MRERWHLLVLDWLLLAGVMVTGFVFHNTLSTATLGRLLWGVFVVDLAWALAALPTGAVDPARGGRLSGWWRWLWALALAAPLAAVLYEAPRKPVLLLSFVAFLSLSAGITIGVGRLLYIAWRHWRRSTTG